MRLPLLLCTLALVAGCSPEPGVTPVAQATAPAPPPSAVERAGLVTMKGNPVTLVGPALAVGQMAPDFTAVDRSFAPVQLSSLRGKAVLISAVPSLDTPVCSEQTMRFNQELGQLGDDVTAITISMDLPFAQARFCSSLEEEHLQVLSDNLHREFGGRYGVLIKEVGLLARSIFVVGKDGRLRYQEIVSEVATHPDYEAALAALREAAAAGE